MREIKAHKTKLSFGETNRYHIFLKQHLLQLNPQYYVVAQRQKIITPDGVMYALRIVQDVEIQNLEPIAECWINSTLIYLWRDFCWAIAVDDRQQPIIKNDRVIIPQKRLRPEPQNKTIVLHRVGISQVK